MGEIQRIESLSQDETDWAANVGQKQNMKSGTMLFGRKEKNDMHKQYELDRVINLIQNERWVGCRPRVEEGCSS